MVLHGCLNTGEGGGGVWLRVGEAKGFSLLEAVERRLDTSRVVVGGRTIQENLNLLFRSVLGRVFWVGLD